MSKVKAEHTRTFMEQDKEVRIIILWDVADDQEGYGVVIGDNDTNVTLSFGNGPLAYHLSGMLYQAMCNELDSIKGDVLPKTFEFDHLNALYDWIQKEVPTLDGDTSTDLYNIINYINKWTIYPITLARPSV